MLSCPNKNLLSFLFSSFFFFPPPSNHGDFCFQVPSALTLSSLCTSAYEGECPFFSFWNVLPPLVLAPIIPVFRDWILSSSHFHGPAYVASIKCTFWMALFMSHLCVSNDLFSSCDHSVGFHHRCVFPKTLASRTCPFWSCCHVIFTLPT